MAVDRTAAAMRMIDTMQLVRTAPISVSRNSVKVSWRMTMVSTSAVATPTAAASEGVAMPV